jgi:heme/copper-type cytochrome/quinol oxidase subunit 2
MATVAGPLVLVLLFGVSGFLWRVNSNAKTQAIAADVAAAKMSDALSPVTIGVAVVLALVVAAALLTFLLRDSRSCSTSYDDANQLGFF